ncbi:MAG: diadenylate cyclase CdaA [Clostridia bacterium]|nr:diadenylate cyclase CdaA [Clostridia bacterium]
MENVLSAFADGFNNLVGVVMGISIGDILDILVLTFLIYKAIKLVRDTHAGQLLKGIIYLLVASLVVNLLDMTMLKMILQMVWELGFIALIVLFQPELRHLLERLGKSKLKMLGRVTMEEEEQTIRNTIDHLVKSSVAMSETKIGALMVLEQSTILNDVVSSGTVVDGAVTRELLCNIFYPKSPLHDGAVVVRNNRVYAASCILPLTQNHDISRELGTRHRSALGMSENSDAVVIVVSEETGTISIAHNGELKRGYDSITLKTELEALLIGDRFENKTENKMKVWKRWSK